jgi:translation initiation factor IF-1
MSKDDHLELDGVIEDAMGGGQYKIRLNEKTKDGQTTYVRAQLAGKMRQRHIRVLAGDRVRVAVSPYDMTHGILTWRYK